MRRALIALLCACLLITALPTFAQTETCTETDGNVAEYSFRSTLIGQDVPYALYTPPCFKAPERANWRYPILYLLHGSDATGTDYWLKLNLTAALDAGIRDGWLPPMLVVLPYGGELANLNQFGAVSFGNLLLSELIPNVEPTFRADGQRETRAIGGISRGGFWAFHLAFRYPGVFGAVGGHSAFFSLEHLRTANPLFLAQSAPDLDRLRIWLDHGRDDYAAPNIALLSRRLGAREIPHQYVVYPEGRHTAAYWRSHVTDYLAFYGEAWLNFQHAPSVIPSPTPSALDMPTRRTTESYVLFVPAAAYKSTYVSLEAAHLRAVREGAYDPQLVVDSATLEKLSAHGVRLHAETLSLPPDELLPLLERERGRYTLRAWEDLTPRWRVLRVDEAHPIDWLLDGDAESYPLALPSAVPNFAADKLTRATFSGVTALVRGTQAALDKYGVLWAAEGLRGFTRRADFFHISNEVSFHPTCPRFEGGRPPGAFCAKEDHFALFEALGVDVVELSGNHNNDYGQAAYLSTLARYQAAGMLTYGGGETLAQARQALSLTHHGNRFALLACNWSGPQMALATDSTPGAAFCDLDWLQEALPQLKATHDVVIMSVQYREFDTFTPTAQQRADFQQLADLGADVVLGTQAHVPQTFAFHNTADGREAFIHFGLGNVYFDQTYFQMRFFMPTVYLYAGQIISVDLFVGIIDSLGRPRPMDTHNRTHFLNHMFAR